MSEGIDGLRDRVSDLEGRVEALTAQVNETAEKSTQHPEAGLDHYDRTALDKMPQGRTFGFASVKTAYQNAGIRDKEKIKERLDHLANVGRVEQTGRFNWKVVEDG